MINQETCLNMVIGHPLQHTQSPMLHNALYQGLNINAVLLAFANEQLSPLIDAIKALHVPLVAVTVPFKVAVLEHLDSVGPEVESLQAANTIIQKNGQLTGANTDIDGVTYALRNTPQALKSALIIGAGGAARSAAYVLKKNNARLFWFNRTAKKAHDLIARFGGDLIEHDQLATLPIDIIINTTPMGMYPHVDQSPLPDYHFKPHQTVFDMVYNPRLTTFLKKAQGKKAHIISGVDMFLAQGLRQIELWQDKKILTDDLIEKLKSSFDVWRPL